MLLRGRLRPPRMSPWGRCSCGRQPGWQMARFLQGEASTQPRAARQGAPGSSGVRAPPPRVPAQNHRVLRFQLSFVKGDSPRVRNSATQKRPGGESPGCPAPSRPGPSWSPIEIRCRGFRPRGGRCLGPGPCGPADPDLPTFNTNSTPPPTCDNRNVPSQAEATTLTTAALSAGVSKTPAGAEE